VKTITEQQETRPQPADAAPVPAGTGWEAFSPRRAPVFLVTAWESD
jgi:hypothetical protein